MKLSHLLWLSFLIFPTSIMAGDKTKCDVKDIAEKAEHSREIEKPEFPKERIVRKGIYTIGQDLMAHPIYYYVAIYPESKLAFVNKGGGVAEISIWFEPIKIDPKRYENCPISEINMAAYDNEHGTK